MWPARRARSPAVEIDRSRGSIEQSPRTTRWTPTIDRSGERAGAARLGKNSASTTRAVPCDTGTPLGTRTPSRLDPEIAIIRARDLV